MNNELSKELDLLRKEFLKEFKLKSYFAANNGFCYEFSSFVYENISSKFGLEELATYELYKVDEDGEIIDDVFDENLILQHTKDVIPLGLTIEQLNEMQIVPHLCLTDWNKYYDCECIKGVESLFELPLYKREFCVLEKYLKETGNFKNGCIASKDISIIKDFKEWTNEFFKRTDEFANAEEFWKAKFPELFIN